MTNKPNEVRVSRELLMQLLTVAAMSASAPYRELRALLDQPADQQGEPFAFISTVTLAVAEDIREYQFGVGRIGARLDRNERHCIPLYLHAQPATAKVVLPERLDLPHRDEFEGADQHAAVVGEAKAWNACLDEVAKLNTPQ
ncbi:hypothetical protein [Pseudomonas syringae group genomosp. 7]|nr:hypothetical protein [Pseudomonas syringae group genomosp. 7]UNB61884.1 hypothetical protein MME54_19940 [Pseudomonas syringae pv. helianthi]